MEHQKAELRKLFQRKDLPNLVIELDTGKTTYEEFVARDKETWEKYYQLAGVDIYKYLHPEKQIPKLGEVDKFHDIFTMISSKPSSTVNGPSFKETEEHIRLLPSTLSSKLASGDAQCTLSDITLAIDQVSIDDLKLPTDGDLPQGNLVKLKIPVIDGTADLLYSPAIYNATRNLGIKPPSETFKTQNAADFNPTMLVGVSGCGKTRCCFDIAASKDVIYFDCANHADFRIFVSSLHHEQDLNPYEITASRFALLLYIRQKLLCRLKPRSSKEFLRYQLNALFQAKSSEIFYQFHRNPPLLPKISTRALIFDECQVTLLDMINRYPDGSGTLYQRPLLSALVRTVHVAKFHSFWAGTHSRLIDVSIVASSVGKPQKVKVFTDFTNYSEVNVRNLLQQWMYADQFRKIPHKLMDQACYLLSGRARFISSFITQLAQQRCSKDKSAEECFSSTLQIIYEMYTSVTNETSFFGFWKKYSSYTVNVLTDPQPKDQKVVFDILLDLVINYFAGSAVFTRQKEVDLISTAMVHIEKNENDVFTYSICEPLPIEAAINYFATLDSDPFLRCFERSLFSLSNYSLGLNSQNRGFIFELVLAIRVRLGWWRYIPQDSTVWNLFPDWCKEALRVLEPPRLVVTQKAGKISPDWCIQNFQADANVFVLPDFHFGPDGLYRFMSYNLKSTWTPNSKGLLRVSKKEALKNKANTNMNNWCAKNDVERRNRILQDSKIYPGMVHFRIEFPASDDDQFHCSKDGNNATICVDLESELAIYIFGKAFIEKWKETLSVRHPRNL